MTEPQAVNMLQTMLNLKMGNSDPHEQLAVEMGIDALKRLPILQETVAELNCELARAESAHMYAMCK